MGERAKEPVQVRVYIIETRLACRLERGKVGIFGSFDLNVLSFV